jgi:hypothetical protein
MVEDNAVMGVFIRNFVILGRKCGKCAEVSTDD